MKGSETPDVGGKGSRGPRKRQKGRGVKLPKEEEIESSRIECEFSSDVYVRQNNS